MDELLIGPGGSNEADVMLIRLTPLEQAAKHLRAVLDILARYEPPIEDGEEAARVWLKNYDEKRAESLNGSAVGARPSAD